MNTDISEKQWVTVARRADLCEGSIAARNGE